MKHGSSFPRGRTRDWVAGMKQTDSEKRQHPRFKVNAKTSVRAFQQLEIPQDAEQAIPGRIVDISEGGICLMTSMPLKTSSPVRCEIPFFLSEVPVSMPALLQVRWTYKAANSNEYRSGLQFLL